MQRKTLLSLALGAALSVSAVAASAQMRITEWMYNGSEFVEFTNVGASAINMAGWSYDDDSRTPGGFDLSGFGIVAAGQSVIMAEDSAADFRTLWNLAASVMVLGGNAANLGRNDEINLYNGATLVDRLTYGDQNFPGTIRTLNISGRPMTAAALGANDVSQWQLSVVGDVEGSFASVGGAFIGSPGATSFVTAVPEPGVYGMLLAGLALLGFSARRRNRA